MQRSPQAGATGVGQTTGEGDRGWGLLATLAGMRVTVALGSRLRGNDEGETEGGDCWRPWLVCE